MSQWQGTLRRPAADPNEPTSMSEQPEHPGYELAYQEALRAITQQQAVLESLRSRAGALLAVASIVTSFLGGFVLGDDGPTGWSWLAIGLFLLGATAVAFVLAPRDQWHFRSEPGVIIRSYVEDDPPAPLWAIQKQLAEHLETDFTANEQNMKPLFTALQLANLALAVEVVVWLVVLVRR
jgi:hypothetical protein